MSADHFKWLVAKAASGSPLSRGEAGEAFDIIMDGGAGEVHFDTAAGIKFRVDGGSVLSDISAVDLDDGAAHTVDIYVNDGVGDVQVGSLSFATLASTGLGSGPLTIDLGTGLYGETSTVVSKTAPLQNYLATNDGTFEVRDSANTLLGTVAYSKIGRASCRERV